MPCRHHRINIQVFYYDQGSESNSHDFQKSIIKQKQS